MSYELKSIVFSDYLYLELAGTLNEAVSRHMVDDVVARLIDSRHRKMLLDVRTLALKTSVIEDYSQAAYTAEQLLGKKITIALWHREIDLGANKFFETVCVNRGANIRSFTDEQDAIDWLMKASTT